MASKGYVNKETQILADNAAEPHIYDEGGITDVVSDHITDIVADNAHEIFDTDETKEAIDGTAVLIQTITTDDYTLSYILDNLNYRKIFIRCVTVTPINEVSATINYNNTLVYSTPLFSTTVNTIKCFFNILFGDFNINLYTTGFNRYNSTISQRNDTTLVNRIRSIEKITINMPTTVGGNIIEIWGVK